MCASLIEKILESLKDNLPPKKGWIGLTTMKVESKQYVTGEPSASSRLFSRGKKKKGMDMINNNEQ